MNNKVTISTEKSKLNVDMVFKFLNEQAAWCKGVPRQTVDKSIANSLCFGAYLGEQQVGFARMVTDYATFANLVDVFVLEEFRGRGFSRILLEAIHSHPELQGLRRITLATSDKHSLYSKFGYSLLGRPEIFMEKFQADVYSKK